MTNDAMEREGWVVFMHKMVKEFYDGISVDVERVYTEQEASDRDCCLLKGVFVDINIVCF